MTKEKKLKLKQNPKRYKKYLQQKRNYLKRWKQKINCNEKLKSKFLKKCRNLPSYIKKREQIKEKHEQRKSSPYWQKPMGYHRYKCHVFQRISKRANNRCKIGKVTAQGLWSLAKKQGLRCPISGEKLTVDNISLDHITPIIKGGTNVLDNLRLVTRAVNTAKHTMSDAEFFLFCQNIINHNNVKVK